MLIDALATAIREVGEANGGGLLLDAGKSRAILTDSARIVDVCRGLKRAGFTRFVDFTGMDTSGGAGLRARQNASPESQAGTAARPTTSDTFSLYLTLRAPEHNHARLTLKWKWMQPAAYAPCDNAVRGAGQPGDEPEAGPVASTVGEPLMAPAGGMNAAPTIHPTLSTIWPAVAVAEREVFEMLGIPFAGNALEPLLLDEAFVGHPLRRGYAAPAPEPYIHKLLEQRHAAGVIEALRLAGGTGASPVAIQASSPSAPARAPQQSVPSSATGEGARATDAGEGTP